jgi:inositol 1,4,5-triphosphate receptor type 1
LCTEYFLSGTRKTKDSRNPNDDPLTSFERVKEQIVDWTPSGSTLYHICFLVASFLGVFMHGYFYAFHLLHLATDNDVLGRVFKAISTSASQLMWVTLLALIVIYMYSVLAFATLRHSFRDEDGMFCETLFQCTMSTISEGLRAGGGLGDVLRPFTYSMYRDAHDTRRVV